jgi:hypothetical protein
MRYYPAHRRGSASLAAQAKTPRGVGSDEAAAQAKMCGMRSTKIRNGPKNARKHTHPNTPYTIVQTHTRNRTPCGVGCPAVRAPTFLSGRSWGWGPRLGAGRFIYSLSSIAFSLPGTARSAVAEERRSHGAPPDFISAATEL